MNPTPTPGDRRDPAASDASRFTYPGGSRPLEGYTIKRGIGHGGFGEVYYATSDAGKEVALKLIRRSLDVELRGIKQCLNLKHPNLLSIHDLRQDERGDHWVIMEYVAGDCLDEVIARSPNGMPVDQTLAWFHGLAAGVAYLHDHGIVHRDLKPGNLFSDEGRVEIGDYGLSKFISCSRRSGHTESVGTVHYMAPEVANGRYGKEIDIYALGVILYEMLTGRVPFEGESVGEVLMKHLTAKPDVSMLAEPYRAVVARALEKDPERRFASVVEMAAALPRPAGLGGKIGPMPSAVLGGVESLGSHASRETPHSAAIPPFVEAVEVRDEEPLLRAVHEFLRNLREGWQALNLPAQIILGALAACGFLMTSGVLIPLGVYALMFYGVYRVIRAVVRAGGHSRRKAAASAAPPRPSAAPSVEARTPSKKHHRRFRPHAVTQPAWIVKPARERLADLIGSMLLVVLVAAAVGLVMVVVAAYRGEVLRPEQGAWLLLVGIAGSWAVMVPAKFWEGTQGEAMPRRFVMMVVGIGLGALAGVASGWLMVALPPDTRLTPHSIQMSSQFYAGPLAFIAVFGTLLAAMRWWKQADPLRTSRLSLWTLFVTSAMAGLVAWAWSFPQPWLVMVACIMSASIQLSSPWLPPNQRPSSEE